MLMHGNPYEEEPEIELMLKDIHALYDEAKKEYDEWDRIARSPHESYEQEGIMINLAKAEGKMIAFKRVIEMFEGPDEEPDIDDGIYDGKDFDEPYGVFPHYDKPEE
jgi:hypothetical protein